MNTGLRENAAALALTAEAAAWALLSRLFERPQRGWHEAVAAQAREVDDALLRAASDAAASARHEEHVALFGPGRAVSPREVSYIGFHDPGAVLAELQAFYQAFAFAPATDEPADHVAVEAAFVGYLCLKEGFALAAGNDAAAAVCADARRTFVNDHLARLGQRLAARVADGAPAWVRLAAGALHARVAHVELSPDVPSIIDEDPLENGCPMAPVD